MNSFVILLFTISCIYIISSDAKSISAEVMDSIKENEKSINETKIELQGKIAELQETIDMLTRNTLRRKEEDSAPELNKNLSDDIMKENQKSIDRARNDINKYTAQEKNRTETLKQLNDRLRAQLDEYRKAKAAPKEEEVGFFESIWNWLKKTFG